MVAKLVTTEKKLHVIGSVIFDNTFARVDTNGFLDVDAAEHISLYQKAPVRCRRSSFGQSEICFIEPTEGRDGGDVNVSLQPKTLHAS